MYGLGIASSIQYLRVANLSQETGLIRRAKFHAVSLNVSVQMM